MAESRAQGRFVAPSTKTPLSSFPTPYISTKNYVLTLEEASFPPPPPPSLLPVIESTSSIKIMEGFFSLAILNRVLIIFSDSPTYLEIKSAAEIEKNVASHSVAQALAKNVLPVPGGPYNNIPFQGVLVPTNICGNLIGKITASCKAFLAFSRPATSSHLIFGFSDTIVSFKAYSNLSFSSFPFILLFDKGLLLFYYYYLSSFDLFCS